MIQICPWEMASEDTVDLFLMGKVGWQHENE